ncbi:MAG: Phospholipase, partial [Nitrospira sp.]|nr:Phospholipase [Nitrospira sp.]
ILPVAPFYIHNAMDGASHIRTREFFLGTVNGEMPGLVRHALFHDQVTETIRHPGWSSILILVGIACLMVVIAWGLSRWLSSRTTEGDYEKSPA